MTPRLEPPTNPVQFTTTFDIRVGCQVLRRTLLLEEGARESVVRSMMGHADQRMTSRYDGTPMETKKAAAENVFAKVVSAGQAGN